MNRSLLFIFFFLSLVTTLSCSQQNQETNNMEKTNTEPTSNQLTQADIDHIANGLGVKYTVLTNRSTGNCKEKEPCFAVEIIFTAQEAIEKMGWTIYLSQLFPLRKYESDSFTYESINGDLKRLIPKENIKALAKGEKLEIVSHHKGDHYNEFKPMPNYYVLAEGLEPRVIKSTIPVIDPETGLEIMPHLTSYDDYEKHFRNSPGDLITWATSAVLFDNNADIKLDTSTLESAIIPSPKKLELAGPGVRVDLSKGVTATYQGIDPAGVAAALSRITSFGIKSAKDGLPLIIKKADGFGEEAYALSVQADAITIEAANEVGAFYALQSLASLITLGETTVPALKISDEPRFEFRGMHLDVSRNFHSKQFVFDFLDQMAAYKLNKLHFHLGDDEGWRLEIPDLPELTDIGAKRCHDLEENTCLLPQLGSGPHGNTEVDGYYSISDYQEILKYASARHIQVIPSFDMPGHSRSSVKAMEARYRKFMAVGKEEEAKRYLLTDPDDTTEYWSIQDYNDNTINVCMPSAYTFVEKVIDETIKMHAEANHPLTRYHIGADETPGAWKESPVCKAYLEDLAKKGEGIEAVELLGGYFIERISKMLESKGIEVGGWNDGMGYTRLEKMPKVVQSNVWGLLQGRASTSANTHANQGWEVVISVPDATYFDMPHEPDPKERGYDWASRYTNTRKVFEFMPENLPIHAEFWVNLGSRPFEINDTEHTYESRAKHGTEKEKKVHKPLEKGKRFVGMQGHLWSETFRSDDQVEYMAFPRLLALAERAWHVASWEVPYDHAGAKFNRESGRFTDELRSERDKQWNLFANVLANKEFAKLDLANIAYRIPTVGAKIIEGKLHANLIFPGLGIEYSVDGQDWQAYQGPIAVEGDSIRVRAIAPDGKRKGRSLEVNWEPIKGSI